MRFRVLGPLLVDGDEAIEIRRPSHRRLIEILAMEPGRRISIDVLIDRFWAGEPPTTARAALHTHISAIRKLLGADQLATDEDGYTLLCAPDDVDAVVFERLAHTSIAAGGHPEAALTNADEALALWRGRPFPDLGDDQFAQPAVRGLEELHLELQETRAAALLALDRAAEVLPSLETLVIQNPLRERMWEHLMIARFRLGRHAEALRAYRQFAAHLEEVGLEPSERLRRLEERILLGDPTLRSTPHNLPDELDEFVGRSSEVSEGTQLLEESRLVTITGPGGSGKTRLAVRVARERMTEHADGIWFVDLGPTRDPSLVPTEVAHAMGLRPHGDDVIGFLTKAVAAADTLIVLDNCEHLVAAAAATVRRLLEEAPHVRVLATSRAPLRVPGESVYELHGLAVPESDDASIEEALASEAVMLFTERATHAQPAFRLTEAGVAEVVAICRRLDGLPLAIELAAARTRSMATTDIADRLDNHLALLTGGSTTSPARQHTLAATIDWSYKLLSRPQRAALNRLSVFRGGFDLGAAESVVSGAGLDAAEISPMVADLVDQSLVVVIDRQTRPRYRLLETVRQFAEARFRETTHATTVYGRHRDWCLKLVGDVWERALGAGRAELVRLLEREADNLQGALEWSRTVDDQRSRALLAGALGWHWYLAGHLSTAAGRLREALSGDSVGRNEILASSLLGRCLTYAEDFDGATTAAADAVSDVDVLDTALERVWVIATLHNIHWMSLQSDPAAMLPLAERAHSIAAMSQDEHAGALAAQLLADALCWNGQAGEGLQLQHDAIDLARATGDARAINETYGASFYNWMLDGQARRNAPTETAREWHALGTLGPEAWHSQATDWLPWVFMQPGDLDAADDAVDRIGQRTLQGYNRTIYFIARASIDWMRGRTSVADEGLSKVGPGAVYRWAHCYYPLVAELAADTGDLDRARGAADEYLAMDVHPSRQASKLGVLYPLVRCAIDRALGTGSSVDAAFAEATLERMHELLERYPPAADGSTSILTHQQSLALAEAEITRLVGPDPEVWRRLAGSADYRYYELYARWRLSEALLTTGDIEEGVEESASALQDCESSGMVGLANRIAETAASYGVRSSADNRA